MHRLLTLLVVVALAGCGRGGVDRLASEGSPAPAPTPVTTAPIGPTAEPSVETSTATVTPLPKPRPSTTQSVASLPPAPSPAPPHGDPLTLTNDDSGRTITIAVGTVIRVRLQPELGSYTPPTSGRPSVVRRDSSTGGYPSDQPVDATFTAVSTGGSELTSTTDAQCLHSQPPCMIPQKQWVVYLVVNR